ncbi:Hypothetical predicted protein, partial [Paramuricea clavata]
MKRLKDILLVLFRIKMVILFIQGTKGGELSNEPLNHQGRSFLLGFLEMDMDSGTCAIYVTSSTPSEITVRYLNKTITSHTRPGVSTRIELSTTIRMKGLALENKGILLTANTTVSVYATNARKNSRGRGSRDVYVIFPTSTLGSQYVITTYTPITKSLAGIIALGDNTLVQIKLRLQGNITYMNKVYQNGDILRIFLNRLQTFQLQYTKDLTGTFVVATGPVVVLGGNICAKVPNSNIGCSHLCTQLVPVSKWGTRFMTSPIIRRDRGGDYFKIVAGFDNTSISIPGKMNLILSAGEHHEFNLGRTEPRYIECSMPVMLMQYNKGSSGYIQSEPFALMVPPIQQYTNSYNLPIPVKNESPPFSNRISFIANTSEFRSIAFDTPKFCKSNLTLLSIPETNFTVYSCELRNIDVSTVIPIRHTSAGGRITTYVVGQTDNDGYGYLGGMEMRDVNCLRLFPVGLTMDNGCDGRIDKDMANITSCDPMLSIVQVPLSKSEYLNGSEVSYNITQNCEGLITRIYNYKTPNGTKVIVAKEEIRWKKRRPTINLPTQTRVNESNISALEIAVRNMSSLCPGDSLKFNDSSSVRENGTEIIQRLWIVREACGRVTTATQTIIVHPTDGEKCGAKKSRTMLLVILITS